MPFRILALWLVLCIGTPLCCCSQTIPSGKVKTGRHACCANKKGHDQKEQGGGCEQCPHKVSKGQITDTGGVNLPSFAIRSVDMLPAWLDMIFIKVLRANANQSDNAVRWREWVANSGSLSFCIRYHALLI